MYFGVRTVIAGGIMLLLSLAMLALFGVLIWYVIRALRKYVGDTPAREEDAAVKRSLGEALKAHRARCGMTQEFVAQSLGGSPVRPFRGRTGIFFARCSGDRGRAALSPRPLWGRGRGGPGSGDPGKRPGGSAGRRQSRSRRRCARR